VFGKRTSLPDLPAHQSRITQLVRAFAASDSGQGKVPKVMEEFEPKTKDPADIAETASGMHHALFHHAPEVSSLLDFVRFLGCLAVFAAIAMIGRALGLA
jgi:hypothetical protein